MALAFESATGAQDQESAGNVSIDAPSGVTDDDALIFCFGGDGNGEFVDYQGFTTDIDELAATSADWLLSAYRIASSEPASYVFDRDEGTEAWAGGLLRFSGADTTDPIGAISAITQGTVDSAGNDEVVSPAVTATADGSIIVRVYVLQGASSSTADSFTVPGTDRTPNAHGGSINEHMWVTTEAGPGAGNSSGTATATLGFNSSPYAAWTFEVLASAAGGGGQPFPPSLHRRLTTTVVRTRYW